MTGPQWAAGNVDEDTTGTRGWLVGYFVDPSKGVRSTADVEVKWARHPDGDTREEWTRGDHRTTLILLVSGHFRVDLTEGSQTMTKPGDYIMWGPGIDHSWFALADSTVITVRWPSSENPPGNEPVERDIPWIGAAQSGRGDLGAGTKDIVRDEMGR